MIFKKSGRVKSLRFFQNWVQWDFFPYLNHDVKQEPQVSLTHLHEDQVFVWVWLNTPVHSPLLYPILQYEKASGFGVWGWRKTFYRGSDVNKIINEWFCLHQNCNTNTHTYIKCMRFNIIITQWVKSSAVFLSMHHWREMIIYLFFFIKGENIIIHHFTA